MTSNSYVTQTGNNKSQSKQQRSSTNTSAYGQPSNTASYGSSSPGYSNNNNNVYGNPSTSTAPAPASYSNNSNVYGNPSASTSAPAPASDYNPYASSSTYGNPSASTSSTYGNPSASTAAVAASDYNPYASSSTYGNTTTASNIGANTSNSGYASQSTTLGTSSSNNSNNDIVYGALPAATSAVTTTTITTNSSASTSASTTINSNTGTSSNSNNNNVYGQLPSSSTSARATTSSSIVPNFSQALDLPPPTQHQPVAALTSAVASSSLSYSSNNNHRGENPIEDQQVHMVHAFAQPAKTGLYQGPTSGLISEGNPVRCHKIDYEIKGYEMQLVEIELDPNETVIGEAGAMMFMEDGIKFESKFGDGSEAKTGFFKKLMAAGGRLMSGESLFITHFTNESQQKARVAFAAPYPGSIVPVNLANQRGQAITCQRDAFLCAALGTKLSMTFNKKIGSGLFGGEGFILEKLEGDGMAFLHAGGTIIKRELNNERIRLDTGCLVAFTTQGISFDIMMVPGLKSMFFGGEGLFLAVLQGTGTIWMQSLPLSRMADRIVQAAPSAGGNRVGEGSRLTGGVGDMIGGGGMGGLGRMF